MIRQAVSPRLVNYQTRGKASAIAATGALQLAVYNARAWNRSGSTIDVGIVRKLTAGLGNKYKLYTGTTGGTVFTAVTDALLAAGQVVATVTNNDGFVVSAGKQFGFFGITVSNTATGGTFAFKYWNGSAWTTLTTISVPADLSASGDNFFAFLPPVDWAAGGPTGVDTAMYSIFVQHTTAPGDTGAINALWVGEFIEYVEGVGDNNSIQVMFDSERPLVLESGEGLFPYFGTANAANAFGTFYCTI